MHDEADEIVERLGSLDPGSIDEVYPRGDTTRVATAERWQFLGKDPITGAERWHHHGYTEIRYADGTVDVTPD